MTEEEKKGAACLEAEACLQAGRYQEAISIYRTLVEAYPAEDSFLLALAWAHYDSGARDKASDCFEKLFNRELTRPVFTGFAYDELVRLYRETGQYDRLVAVCKRAAEAQPEDMDILGELGDAYLRAGQARVATAILKSITAREPACAAAHCRLGEALTGAGEYVQAESAYERAVELEPEAACLFYGRLANGYMKVGEHARAERIINKCLAIRGDEPLYHCLAGDCLIGQGEITAAGAAYSRAIALSPSSEGLFLNRWGNTLAQASHHQEAIEVFKRAFAKDANPLYLLRLSESYAALGRCGDEESS